VKFLNQSLKLQPSFPFIHRTTQFAYTAEIHSKGTRISQLYWSSIESRWHPLYGEALPLSSAGQKKHEAFECNRNSMEN
jgi:hypothetical protein